MEPTEFPNAKRPPTVLVELSDSYHPSAKICSHLLCELIKCLLYMRQQIPSPYETLKQAAEHPYSALQNLSPAASSNPTSTSIAMKPRRNCSERKSRKLIAPAELLFQQLHSLILKTDVSCFLIAFGATIFTAKELFLVTFDRVQEYPEELVENSPPQTKFEANCVRKMIRTIVTSYSPHTELAPTKIFILVRCNRNHIPPAFLPKPNFTGIHNSKVQPVYIHICKQWSETAELDCNSNTKAVDSELSCQTWFQYCHCLQGFRTQDDSQLF